MKKMRLFSLILGVMFCGIAALQAQVSLTGTSYTETFDGIGTGYPTGWSLKVHATATALGTDTVLTTPNVKWTLTTKGVKNFASADGLTITSDSAAQTNSTDRALGLRQTGSWADAGAAYTVQIANTTDMNTFGLAFKLQSLDSSSHRTAVWKVQFATGAAPTVFTDLVTTPATLTTGGGVWSNTSVTASFGALLDNQAGPVWIRIVELAATTGSGNRPSTGVDDFNLTWTNGAATTVAAPVFTPQAGTYYNSVNVTIATSTPGAEVRYTLDGTTPTAASTLYTAPIAVTSTKTINAIGIKTGLTNSTVSSAIYTIATPTACANIAELKTKVADNSTVYSISGEAVMTFKQTNRNQKFVQDATGAILIDDVNGAITTAYNVGDGITGITGKLTSYFGMFQFVPIQDAGVATTTANVITPLDVTITEMLDSVAFKVNQSKVIRIVGASFTDANGTVAFATNKKYRVTAAGTTDSTFKTSFYTVDYMTTVLPQGSGSITGIAQFLYGRYHITARNAADISISQGINEANSNSINVYPNPTKNNLYVSLDGTYDITVISLLGQRVYNQNDASGTVRIDCSSLGKGVFFVQARNAKNQTITKRIVVE
ncbi:MAG: chitobiase/beta-hexosaminidase C-terminal domain-containing protein [Bacteroidota bacterium]